MIGCALSKKDLHLCSMLRCSQLGKGESQSVWRVVDIDPKGPIRRLKQMGICEDVLDRNVYGSLSEFVRECC